MDACRCLKSQFQKHIWEISLTVFVAIVDVYVETVVVTVDVEQKDGLLASI
jgi:hypothetical protein